MKKSPIGSRSGIDQFIDSLWAQKGLAELTLERLSTGSYAVFALARAAKQCLVEGRSVERFKQFLAQRFERGASARSNARLLSTLKQYYRHLVRLGNARTIRPR